MNNKFCIIFGISFFIIFIIGIIFTSKNNIIENFADSVTSSTSISVESEELKKCRECEKGSEVVDKGGCHNWCSVNDTCETTDSGNSVDCSKHKEELTKEYEIDICKKCKRGTHLLDDGGCHHWCSEMNKCGTSKTYSNNGVNCAPHIKDIEKAYNKSKNKDINIQNDIIAEDNIKINGITIDIDKLRYIKKIPIHYQNEICLSDTKGDIECLKKEHIDMIKGKLPLNIITYPDNYRKCLTAVDKNIIPEWNMDIKKYNTYTGKECKDGTDDMEFYIQRNNIGIDDTSIHADYHGHEIDKVIHYDHDEEVFNIDINESQFKTYPVS